MPQYIVNYTDEMLEKYISDCAKRAVDIGSFPEDVARQMCIDGKDQWWDDFIGEVIRQSERPLNYS